MSEYVRVNVHHNITAVVQLEKELVDELCHTGFDEDVLVREGREGRERRERRGRQMEEERVREHSWCQSLSRHTF